jgi:hypothetical protein
VLLLAGPPPAEAVILQPSVIDGPSSEAITLGNVAMAPDGTGGLVYTKTVEGKPHVFASRFDGTNWSPPIRVDGENRFEASEPRIAAGSDGRLLVVWVDQVATLANGEIQRALFSAALGPRSGEFGAQLLVDPNLKIGTAVDPSVAGATPGKAIVAYRVVTQVAGQPGILPPVLLRPEDVIAEIRVARLEGDRWSRLGAINRDPAISMRAPTEANGPQVAIGASGRAVVAWQEPDTTGAARILFRRIAGTSLGPIFLASPETFDGKPITEDATAFSLGVTATDRARVAARVEGAVTSPLGGPRIFVTSLGSSSTAAGAKPTGPEEADGAGATPPAGPIGPPVVSVADGPGAEGALNLGYTSGTGVQSVGVDTKGKLLPPRGIGGTAATPGSPLVVSVGPEGGSVFAYQAADQSGSPTVVVRQEFPEGELQTGFLYGPLGGPVSRLSGAGSGQGDALLAFGQGESGLTAIIADQVSAPPENFSVQVPEGWVKPSAAKIRWQPPQSATGGLTYELVVNGRIVGSRFSALQVKPPAALLGSGIAKVSVIATDRVGGEVLSRPASLRVDARPPTLAMKVLRGKDSVLMKLTDTQSGLARGSVRVSYGDGGHGRGRAKFHHRYARPGRYTVRVRARDRVGNQLTQRAVVEVG